MDGPFIEEENEESSANASSILLFGQTQNASYGDAFSASKGSDDGNAYNSSQETPTITEGEKQQIPGETPIPGTMSFDSECIDMEIRLAPEAPYSIEWSEASSISDVSDTINVPGFGDCGYDSSIYETVTLTYFVATSLGNSTVHGRVSSISDGSSLPLSTKSSNH